MPELKPMQRHDVEFIKRKKHRVLIANAPGTGKTPTAIRAVVEEYKSTLPCLIICPSSVTHNWRKEIKIWAQGVSCHIIEGYNSKLPVLPRETFYICSWSILDARWEDLEALRLRTIVADEAHFAKNPDAQRSQALRGLCTADKGIILLTGTPIVNSKKELVVLQELYGSTPPMIRRMLVDVAPDIPQKKRSYLYIDMKDKDAKNYKRAEQDFETWLREKNDELTGEGKSEAEIERIMSVEAMIKLGYLRRLVGEAKVFAASDFIARAVRIGEPVVVFLEHQICLHRLSKLLRKQRIRHAIIEGNTSPKKRQQYIEQFQENHFPVMICTKAGKEGITLHAARHLIFVERFFTSADEEQAEDRIRRIGQKFKTTIWYMHVQDTVDDSIDMIVRRKRDLIDAEIGSETVEETDETAVTNLIAQWSEFTSKGKKEPTSTLGQGQALDPLPGPKVTHAVVFSGERWKLKSCEIWCGMNGYEITKVEQLQNRYKLITHPAAVFRKNTFKIIQVSRDIKIIVGDKLPEEQQRVMRAKLRVQ